MKKYIKMGQPVFEITRLIEEHKLQVFSSNYSLYADMSARFMSILSAFSPRAEIYSIDEAFLELTDLPIDDLTSFGREIKARVWQYIGIPVSVGIAATKSLSKIAREIVKQDPTYDSREVMVNAEYSSRDFALCAITLQVKKSKHNVSVHPY